MPINNVRQFFKHFHSDEICLEHLFKVRFGQGHECSKCKRKSNWYRIQAEQAFSCQWCGHHLHPMVGTIFEKSSTPLQLWFFAIFLFTTTRNGVSAKELQRQLGVTYKTAWRMGHKIREHMAAVDGDNILGGTVEVDEAFIGGRRPMKQKNSNKTIVMGMAEKGGEIVTEIIPDRTSRSMLNPIIENVEYGTEIHTDEHPSYYELSHTDYYSHKTVDHSKNEYVGKLGQTTNTVEGFFAQLKRTIAGTHIWVSGKYLHNYAKECEYRFNRRAVSSSMFPELVSTFPKL